MFAACSECFDLLFFRQFADIHPILFQGIFINTDIRVVECIRTVFSAAGYLVVLSGFDFIKIRLEAMAFEGSKGARLIVDSFAVVTNLDPADSCGSGEAVPFVLDPHHSFHLCLLTIE